MNADGDAYASILTAAYWLEKWEKSFQIIIDDEGVDKKYSYLWGADKIKSFDPDWNENFSAAIILDVPNLNRVGRPAHLMPNKTKCIKIDHHPEEEDFAHYNLVNDEASSTSQILYELIRQAEIAMTSDLATLIFTGIMYDTGRFSFSNTRQVDFKIGADLVKYGANPKDIANRLFFNNSFNSMKILGYALSTMKSFLDGKLCIIHLPLEKIKDQNQGELEELANYSVGIEGVEVGIFVREVEPDFFKISFRSKGRINVNLIAGQLGGGGHDHAAGARYSGNIHELTEKLKKLVSNTL
jgi:phosphoesterase RecJ-like protein